MKGKTLKKLLALGLAGAMALSCAACGNKGGEPTLETDENCKTFKIVTVRHNDVNPTDFLYEGVMQQIAEKHGVTIEWEVYTASDWNEQKTLLFASPEDLPDAFLGSLAVSDGDIQVYKDLFVELTDYIDKDMPNLSQIMQDDAQFKASMITPEGDIYSLGKKLPLRPQVHDEMYINQKWLDNLGLAVPTTYEELADVLEAFKTKDADGDGDPNNEIPYTAFGSLAVDSRTILSPFGTITSTAGNYMGLDANDEPYFMPTSDNYKEAVKWMHELYESGAVDPEYFTQDMNMVNSKIMATDGSQVGLISGWTTDSAAGVNAGEFTKLEALQGPDGNRYVYYDPTYYDMNGTEFIVTKNCKNVDLLLKWADELYTNEVTMQTYWGSIPNQIADNGDGTYSLLPPAGDDSYDTTAWSNSFRDFGPKYMTEDFEEKVQLPEDSGDGQKLAEDLNFKYSKATFPVLRYTADEYSAMGRYTADINTYAETQYAHWIVDGGVEEEWDNYVSTLEQMGLEDLVSIYTTAYDRYLSAQE